MPELVPYPFGLLVRRMFAELDREDSIFALPRRKFYRGSERHDLAVHLHGRRASSPLGPAAGPHTQLAQNIVLGWLAGCRIFELKTVQVRDDLTIPRPCIDVRAIGYNAEWSQELTIAESLTEYVKASMLVTILRESGRIDLLPGFSDTIFDMSVGYDLAGISSGKVGRFLDGMRDASSIIDPLRRAIPVEHERFRDLDFDRCISDTVTLSTFHGCPPDEVERIAMHLMRDRGLHCIIKLNPTLLGPLPLRHLLHDILGYVDVRVPDSAFERDMQWEQAIAMVARLHQAAAECGTGFGVKFTNTLVVENTTGFLPEEEREVYLSGAPLHVLAMHLVAQFRRTFGHTIPLSFSAGIDANNYASAVALGLAPVTVCTDLLRPGGYGRLAAYHAKLEQAMDAVGSPSVDDFAIHAMGNAEAALTIVAAPGTTPAADLRSRWTSAAVLLNGETYVAAITADARYAFARNSRAPAHVARSLALFDCITCDKCIPVCPNDANFAFATGQARLPRLTLRGTPEAPVFDREDDLQLTADHQLGTFADFCNLCGNCDVFCPEEGAPYAIKPLFFGSEKHWRASPGRDGFFITPHLVLGRAAGSEYRLERNGDQSRFSGEGFSVELRLDSPETTVRGAWSRPVPLYWCYVMDLLRRAVLDPSRINYVNVAWSDSSQSTLGAAATMPRSSSSTTDSGS